MRLCLGCRQGEGLNLGYQGGVAASYFLITPVAEGDRLEKRTVSICTQLDGIKPWTGLQTLIRVDSQRQLKKEGQRPIEKETRYYIASFQESAESFARRIRGYWGVENKAHYVRDVT